MRSQRRKAGGVLPAPAYPLSLRLPDCVLSLAVRATDNETLLASALGHKPVAEGLSRPGLTPAAAADVDGLDWFRP